jgi:HD-GYP domain-containing protein (c-di-GMP phosphodiesterase class II)
MNADSTPWLRQPAVALAAAIVTVTGLTLTSLINLVSHTPSIDAQTLMLAPALAVVVLLAYLFPIYIRHNTKICLTTIPLYLMAALLPAPLAGSAALVAVLGAELALQSRRGTHLADLATNASRWSLLTLVAALIAHIGVPDASGVAANIPALGAAIFLWIGDLLTLPIVLHPVSGERPTRIIALTLSEGGLAEASQYGVGFIGIVLANQQVWALALLVVPAALVYLSFRKEVDVDTFQLLESMADSVDLRDGYTVGHSRRVAALAEGIMDELGMHGQEAKQIITAARLHDIGKVAIPDHIMIKSGSLTPEEQTIMESAPDRAAEMLAAYPDLSRGLEMVRHHHERWDGTGYPAKLAATDIPFGARVIAVADSYDAMTSDRPYRRALTSDQSAQILWDGRSRHWDAAIVEAFLRSISDELTWMPAEMPSPAAQTAPLPNGKRVTI